MFSIQKISLNFVEKWDSDIDSIYPQLVKKLNEKMDENPSDILVGVLHCIEN